MDYKKVAQEIYDKVGRKENIVSAAHCATRLRLVLVDNAKCDAKAVEEIEGVKGAFSASGQLQIILGTGVVNKVYDEFIAIAGISAATKDEVKAGDKLLTFDRKKIAAAGHPDMVAVLLTNADDFGEMTVHTGACQALQPLLEVAAR